MSLESKWYDSHVETIGQPMMVNKICFEENRWKSGVAELMDTVGPGFCSARPMRIHTNPDGGRRQRIGIASPSQSKSSLSAMSRYRL